MCNLFKNQDFDITHVELTNYYVTKGMMDVIIMQPSKAVS